MFCRHGRFEENCAICRREKAEAAQAKTPAAKGTARRRPSSTARPAAAGAPSGGRRRGVVTGKLMRNADDGYRSDLLPGLHSSADVRALARALAEAEARLEAHVSDAGPWAQVGAHAGEPARAFVAALVVALASPDEAAGSQQTALAALGTLAEEHPQFQTLATAGATAPRTAAMLDAGPRGPRAHDASGAALAVPAQLAARAGGSLDAAILGEASWPEERRFARLLDRLALRGLPRAARFDLLTALGRSRALPVRAGALHLGGDQVTDAAKRIFAVADAGLLEQRAAALVETTGVAFDALELALWNLSGVDATGVGAAARWATARPATGLGLPGAPDEELAGDIAGLLGA